MLRVLLRCSPLLDWQVTAAHASEMNRRIQNAGYSYQFRKQITESALNTYKNIIEKDRTGECPLYRNKTWQKQERDKKKQQNKSTWYKRNSNNKSIIFVPATPKSKLQKEYKKIINKHKLGIKVVEKSGTQIKHIIQKSDPFKNNKYPDKECFTCMTNNNNKQTNCRKEGVTYKITCNKCPAVYIGETSRNGITRGKEHVTDFINKRDHSIMLRHAQTCHPEEINNTPNFSMTITNIYKNKPLDRQLSEAIQINNLKEEHKINGKTEYINHILPRTIVSSQ